jgi:D-beta-D-heptose 7-phosphate kinase/D-beta-D-heptose 1-phosphate adenosyltransferase
MKICLDLEQLNGCLDQRREEKVAFTNGVFDIIHPGHVALLEFARRQGDLLVVGVNDDDSVRRLKGPERPIFPLAERMAVLTAMACVDLIIPFGEETPQLLIERIRRIDVLVKGGDYLARYVVGAAEVTGSGGRVLIFPLQAAYSSSALIAKIRGGA